ncbi:hypothetical protein BFP70_11290 [Thioclava sp. SK-1]|uniref:DUF805 domain-containing protein n=1 Tax=Thioclava sp. SK-1 TaxID=1889770 RepID=UPI000825653D|nr:DUF805 domain-containing protein [Thioclava sp. SK-1]OCX64601.1 hypothetical protein BFP70_11290 [Thioclava sp. SK-1]
MARYWFYLDGTAPQGPITEQVLVKMIGSGSISSETYLWHADLPDWQPACAHFHFDTASQDSVPMDPADQFQTFDPQPRNHGRNDFITRVQHNTGASASIRAESVASTGAAPFCGPLRAIAHGYRKMFQRCGRASRSEFWFFMLAVAAQQLVFSLGLKTLLSPADLAGSAMDATASSLWWGVMIAYGAISLINFIAGATLSIRRLHDTGRSGHIIAFQFLLQLVTICLVGFYAYELAAATMAEYGTITPMTEPSMATVLEKLAGAAVCSVMSAVLALVILIFTLLPGQNRPNTYG